MKIRRGDIYQCELGRGKGSETFGTRPCVVVSNNTNNRYAPVITVVPLTTGQKAELPVHVKVHCQGLESTAMCELIRAISITRARTWLGEVREEELKAIDAALRVQLALEEEII